MNWIYQKGYQDMPSGDLYVTAFYFTVTTLVTVGYGDITAYSLEEKLLCIVLMLIGVISFSFATGALASIITSNDTKEALIAEKIATLNEIQLEYDVSIELFNKLARTIKFDYSKKQKDVL
jgi:Ion channel